MSDDPLWIVWWSSDDDQYVQACDRDRAIEAAYRNPPFLLPQGARVTLVKRVD